MQGCKECEERERMLRDANRDAEIKSLRDIAEAFETALNVLDRRVRVLEEAPKQPPKRVR